ncbi:MAG: hypothetical protein IJI46_01530 [Erysipelotrichaceae bacterium]|nr:hypothetical protein [Erysipelotrichaceae bacterium]
MKVLFARDVLEQAIYSESQSRDFEVLLNFCQDGIIEGYACTYSLLLMVEELDRESMKQVINILDCLLKLIDVTPHEVRMALNKADFEQAINLSVAKRRRLDCIVTKDKNGFNKSTIKVYDPASLRRELEDGKTA